MFHKFCHLKSMPYKNWLEKSHLEYLSEIRDVTANLPSRDSTYLPATEQSITADNRIEVMSGITDCSCHAPRASDHPRAIRRLTAFPPAREGQ
jgi:hypothetical protein